MRRFFLLGCCVCTLASCTLRAASTDDHRSSTGSATRPWSSSFSTSRPSLACAPDNPEWERIEVLYDETEHSVHELITCGGLQVRIASNIVAMLIASNEDLFKDAERAFIADLMLNPFTHSADGTWTMSIPDSPGSSFALSFYDPTSGELIEDDVFDLDSFLQGVHIQTEVSFDQMLSNPGKKHAFVFRWDAEGPLAHLMNGGEALPDGFELQLALADFLAATPADFGPFASVFDIEVASVVDYFDDRSETTVEYQVSAKRDALGAIAASQSLSYEVDRIESTAGPLTMVGNTDELSFVHLGELAGQIEYSVRGELETEPVAIEVMSDFGAGAAYPETEWSCAQ